MAAASDHPEHGLRVELENHLPASLPAGCATAVFCYGHCFHRRERVAELELQAGADRSRADAIRMPRRDLYQWLGGTEADPEGHSYRSGFWGVVGVRAPSDRGAVELSATVRLASGASLRRPLGWIEVTAPAARAPGADGSIAICMATFEPEPALLVAQLESLRAQTDRRWVCLISDGGSSAGRFASLMRAVEGDDRFVVSRSERRLDPYRNFERALAMVPDRAELVALCDQDDRWYPEKLAQLRAGLGTGQLVYSDQRLVSEDGRVLRHSLWEGRRNDPRNLASMLVAGAVPGAAMLFRRELLELALPFPDAPGIQFHDHWLALVALCSGELRYVDRPLYDFVQHAGSVSGGGTADSGPSPGSRGWRAAYFGGFVPREVMARTLLERCDASLTARRRRALERFASAAGSPPAFAWLALRPLRRLIGRDETLGGETALVRGILWRWLIVLAVGRSELPGRRAYDASFPDPPRFEQRRLRRWRTGA